MEPPTVVIDNGTGYTKMGYAGNVDPSYIVPSVIATREKKNVSTIVNDFQNNNKLLINDLDFYIGDEAEAAPKNQY